MTAVLVFACLVLAVLLGRICSQRLSEHRLTAETRDTIKLSLGLVATMSALLLGLLVSSAKGAYDSQSQQVDQMAAKVAALDRVLALYGVESAGVRQELRANRRERNRPSMAAAGEREQRFDARFPQR